MSDKGNSWIICWSLNGRFSSSQQEEKDRETPKDSLDDLFPNDEEEHGQGSKNKQQQWLIWLSE